MFGSGENKRYNLEFTISARNVLNTVNLAPPVGNLSSPLFGPWNALAVGGSFGGSSSGNRPVALEARFLF